MNKPKFRAWDKNEEKWIGIKHLGYYDDGELWYLQSQDENGVDCDPPYFEDDLGVSWDLMQYTGLKDKNGVEIFGKDFVEGFYGGTYVKGVIQFIDGCHCLQRIGDFHAICLFEVDNRNILGSIHANPELLNEVGK